MKRRWNWLLASVLAVSLLAGCGGAGMKAENSTSGATMDMAAPEMSMPMEPADIGIDAEELGRRVDLRLAEKILSPGERAQFDAAPDKRRALLTFWVLKEALVKKTGEGLRGYPSGTDFSLDDPRVTEIDGCLVAVIE